jgi:4-alpha-glucanotransferase
LPVETGILRKLAQLYGIQTAFYGVHHKRSSARSKPLLAVLKSLGAPIASLDDAAFAIHDRLNKLNSKVLEPVIVVWEGKLEFVVIRLQNSCAGDTVKIRLTLEDGSYREWQNALENLPVIRRVEHDKEIYFERKLSVEAQIPFGYHHLSIETGRLLAETLILSAPVHAWNQESSQKTWGAFLPLYALYSQSNWGAGTYSDLKMFIDCVGAFGGSSVASLPLLPTFLDKPYEPSPYLPVSKLFWNEFYIDVDRVPEFKECTEAQALNNSTPFQQTVQSLRRGRLVNYYQEMTLKRAVLMVLCEQFFLHASPRLRKFNQFVRNNPETEIYGRFRAVNEGQKKPWYQWQSRLKDGNIKSGEFDEKVKRYHLYVQWLAHEQMSEIARHASEKGMSLYLDLPLGTHPEGFDTWRYRNIFVEGVSAGAPPDIVFTNGQNWTFPPLHPEGIRESGYKYVISYLRHHLELAKILRIDHIMGLHRLYFIPSGFESSEGVYVRYHAEELYAVLCIESWRHQSVIVGEDLGIVPREVTTSMRLHNLQRMWVMHYEIAGNNGSLPSPMSQSVASLNTHDMPPFASFWTMRDISDRVKTGIINRVKARQEETARAAIKRKLVRFLRKKDLLSKQSDRAIDVLKGCLSLLALSRAHFVLVNIEDLWLETNSQNIPGTTSEHPNWRRKARYSLETFCQMSKVMSILREINTLRSVRRSSHGTGQTGKRR